VPAADSATLGIVESGRRAGSRSLSGFEGPAGRARQHPARDRCSAARCTQDFPRARRTFPVPSTGLEPVAFRLGDSERPSSTCAPVR